MHVQKPAARPHTWLVGRARQPAGWSYPGSADRPADPKLSRVPGRSHAAAPGLKVRADGGPACRGQRRAQLRATTSAAGWELVALGSQGRSPGPRVGRATRAPPGPGHQTKGHPGPGHHQGHQTPHQSCSWPSLGFEGAESNHQQPIVDATTLKQFHARQFFICFELQLPNVWSVLSDGRMSEIL